jgi:hypothetical protein
MGNLLIADLGFRISDWKEQRTEILEFGSVNAEFGMWKAEI